MNNDKKLTQYKYNDQKSFNLKPIELRNELINMISNPVALYKLSVNDATYASSNINKLYKRVQDLKLEGIKPLAIKKKVKYVSLIQKLAQRKINQEKKAFMRRKIKNKITKSLQSMKRFIFEDKKLHKKEKLVNTRPHLLLKRKLNYYSGDDLIKKFIYYHKKDNNYFENNRDKIKEKIKDCNLIPFDSICKNNPNKCFKHNINEIPLKSTIDKTKENPYILKLKNKLIANYTKYNTNLNKKIKSDDQESFSYLTDSSFVKVTINNIDTSNTLFDTSKNRFETSRTNNKLIHIKNDNLYTGSTTERQKAEAFTTIETARSKQNNSNSKKSKNRFISPIKSKNKYSSILKKENSEKEKLKSELIFNLNGKEIRTYNKITTSSLIFIDANKEVQLKQANDKEKANNKVYEESFNNKQSNILKNYNKIKKNHEINQLIDNHKEIKFNKATLIKCKKKIVSNIDKIISKTKNINVQNPLLVDINEGITIKKEFVRDNIQTAIPIKNKIRGINYYNTIDQQTTYKSRQKQSFMNTIESSINRENSFSTRIKNSNLIKCCNRTIDTTLNNTFHLIKAAVNHNKSIIKMKHKLYNDNNDRLLNYGKVDIINKMKFDNFNPLSCKIRKKDLYANSLRLANSVKKINF